MYNNNTKYTRISADEVPANIRWDTPQENQGQIVLVSYSWGRRREFSEAGPGSPYQRVEDQSVPVNDPDRISYLKRVGPA